jgi:DNA primase
MSLPHGFLDELRARINIVDVVGRKVRLTRKGHEHTGLCPFHNEKTPSFTVSAEKGFYHCFGCGAHGDAISFEMNANGLPFMEAVERLATEAGLEVPQATPEEAARSRRANSLHEVIEAACQFYEQKLHMPEGRAALDYARGRGLTPETMRRFRLGYAPSGNALRAALTRDGWEESALVEAGLIGRPDDGRAPYDILRNRLTFPITDRRGRVIAFGGRILGDGQPKYLNSPETPVFHKGRVLYGLAQARAAAFEKGRVLVAEGYMDVIGLSQAGIAEAVAPLGTALTEGHMHELWKLSNEPYLCFDGDAAGQRAARRAADRALPELKPGYSLQFCVLPGGQDPDDLVKSGGVAAMEALLSAARPLSDVLWDMVLEGRDVSTPERRAALEKDIYATCARITDETVKGYYQRDLRDRMFALFRQARGGGSGPDSGARGGFENSFSRSRFRRGKGNWQGKWQPPEPSTPPPASPTDSNPNARELVAGLSLCPGYAIKHLDGLSRMDLRDSQAQAYLSALLGAVADLDPVEQNEAAMCVALRERIPAGVRAPIEAWAERTRWTQMDPYERECRVGQLALTMRDQALAEEIQVIQSLMAQDFSENLWQRLRALRHEREKLRQLDGEA